MNRLDLAHITDVHLGPLPPARLFELMSKRAFGYLSWHRRRHRLHRLDALEALAVDLAADPPGHLAVTGDLVNIALPAEFVQAARWLAATAAPEDLTLVPGNHDAYAGRSYRKSWSSWHAYMRGDDMSAAGTFPFVRKITERIALVGLSSAVPSPIGRATGRLGPAQVEALDSLLADFAADGFCRIVLLHHPPLGRRISRRRGLLDEPALREVLARRGAELVLAGHEHGFHFGDLPGPRRPVPIFVAPSASLALGHPETGGYLRHCVELDESGTGQPPRLVVQLRRFDPLEGRLVIERTGRVGNGEGGLRLEPATWPLGRAENERESVVEAAP